MIHRHLRAPCTAAAGAAAAAALALVAPSIASAHAVVPAGPYHVAIGWQYEPLGSPVTYVGQPNGIQVFIDQPSGGNPIGTAVADLNADCTKPDFQVTVTFGSKTSSPLCPQPAFDADTGRGRQDEYDVPLTPTKVGNYTFRIFGAIHGTAIDQTVTSSDSTFDPVGEQSSSGSEFPTAIPGLSDIGAKVNALGPRADDAQKNASDAINTAAGATGLAYVAIIVAVIAVALSVVLTRRRRT